MAYITTNHIPSNHSFSSPSLGNGGLVNYKIISGSEGKFEIDESTGLITTIDYLDYETKTSYLMNVSATDQAPPQNQGFCSIYVSLLNELDEAVQFSNITYEATITENIPLGSEVLRVQARSIDNLNQITYKFDPNTNPQALSLFKINGITVSNLLGDFCYLWTSPDMGYWWPVCLYFFPAGCDYSQRTSGSRERRCLHLNCCGG